MSRLFSHLENIGHDRTDAERTGVPPEVGAAAPPLPATEQGPQPSSASPEAYSQAPARPDYRPASTVQSPLPGYAIASQLALSSAPQLHPPPSRPTWSVRLWFFALLALIGLSLAMLLLPREDGTAAQRSEPRASDITLEPPDDVKPSPSSVRAEAAAGAMNETADAPGPRSEVQRPPSPPAVAAPVPPARAPAGDAGCSAAMAAMNLCSPSHP